MDEICLVTGGSRGIGKAICEALGSAGCLVVGTATTAEGAHTITESFKKIEIPGKGCRLDVRDQESVDKLLGEIETEYGSVSVLVNNAGVTGDSLLLRMKEQDWDDIIDTNLKSLYRLSKAVLRKMTKARHGRIINIGSVVGSAGNAGQSNYAAAKAGMIGFTRALAREVASRNITVNTVAPGFIDTDMTTRLPESQRERLIESVPLGRLGYPHEVAALVAFLASDAGAYITGQVLHVNGGMYMG